MSKNRIRLTESDLHRIIRESVKRVLAEEIDMHDAQTWIEDPETLKGMGYDEDGMRNGKKYYDHLLNPNWRFNVDKGYSDGALDYILGNNKDIERDIKSRERNNTIKNKRGFDAADKRQLHRKGSLNRDY